jgi:cytochrome c oxidase assembly protein subunit 11
MPIERAPIERTRAEGSARRGAARRRMRMLFALVGVVAAMGGMSFAAVPLYRAFCQATGFAGTPQIGPQASPGAVAASIVVRFDANTSPALPWRFSPDQAAVTTHLGAEQVAFYHATNQAATPVSGVALYNVTPERVGRYFHKTACFCFSQQTLAPGETMAFPVSFWVDPAIAADPDTRDIHTITLSYTFYPSLDDAAKTGALAKAGPMAAPSAPPGPPQPVLR